MTSPPTGVHWLSMVELGDAYRRRMLSPVEVTRALLGRIEALNPDLNAFLTVTGDLALAEARRAEEELRRGIDRGPLHGVPYALKDLIATAGIRTTCGSSLRADWVPDEGAVVAQRLRDAGAVLLGKTHLHEFAYGATNANPHYGPARNPWNRERATGGSSGGSAGAVAAGLAPLALGTDTGGSVRIPSALCGIVGLKTTFGRVSTRGVFPLSWSQDTVGPMTRSAEDAALALQALAGPDPRDPHAARVPVPDYRAALGSPIAGLRFGVWEEAMAFADPIVREAVEVALETFRMQGAEIISLSWSRLDLLGAAASILLYVDASVVHAADLRRAPQRYGEDVRGRLELGTLIPATAYVKAQRLRRLLLDEYRRLFERVDAIISPTCSLPAPGVDRPFVTLRRVKIDVRPALSALTRPYNAIGAPAISVPCGFSPDGLPLGLQVAGPPWSEPLLLRAAAAYQQATRWHTRRPLLAASA